MDRPLGIIIQIALQNLKGVCLNETTSTKGRWGGRGFRLKGKSEKAARGATRARVV